MRHESVGSISEEQTEAVAMALAARTPPGATLCLTGDLGAGKTVFARGFARGMGITGPITSPTFTLVNSYEGRMPDGSRRTLHHFDLYRISDPDELHDIGWEEYFDGESVCLVEWPDRAGPYLPANCVAVEIQLVAPETEASGQEDGNGAAGWETSCHRQIRIDWNRGQA